MYLVVTKVFETKTIEEEDSPVFGRRYKKVAFKELPDYINIGGIEKEVKNNKPVRYRILFERFENSSGDSYIGDPLFDNIREDDVVEGSIKTLDVLPYEVDNADGTTTTLDKATIVVFEFEDVISAFKSAGFEIPSEETTAIREEFNTEKENSSNKSLIQ